MIRSARMYRWRVLAERSFDRIMNKEIVIASMPVYEKPAVVTVLYEDRRPAEIFVNSRGKEELLGGIYVGVIEKIQKNINAAYVRIGKELTAYLPLGEADRAEDFVMKTKRDGQQKLRAGDELLVQISTDALKTKLPCLTGNLSFPGKYIVLTTRMKKVSFSRKLDQEDKIRLRKVFTKRMYKDFGIIVRTNAAEATEEQLKAEYEELKEKALEVCTYGPSRTVYSRLLAPLQDWERVIRRCASDELKRIITDIPDIYDSICRKKASMKLSESTKTELYQDKMLELFRMKSLETLVHRSTSKQVELRSGGNLVIEETEAFVVIDINSGKYESRRDTEESRRLINYEAASMIARQIRLRQLSGTILVDFINMNDRRRDKELIDHMKKLVIADPVRTTVVDITPLSIMEITREKKRKSLKEQIRELSN